MNPIRCLIPLLCLTLAACIAGCGGAKVVPGPDVPMATVQLECKKLKPEQVRDRVMAYRDLVRKQVALLLELDAKIAEGEADETKYSSDDLAKMKLDRETLDKGRMALTDRFQAYFTAYRLTGGDVGSLHIEDTETLQQKIDRLIKEDSSGATAP